MIVQITSALADSEQSATSNLDVVDRFVAAFNARQPSDMLSLCNEDFRWVSVDAAGASVVLEGKAALRSSLLEMFASDEQTSSALVERFESGNWVTGLERATWGAGDAKKSQCSIAVYELRDYRISSVWYFPSHACPDEAPASPPADVSLIR